MVLFTRLNLVFCLCFTSTGPLQIFALFTLSQIMTEESELVSWHLKWPENGGDQIMFLQWITHGQGGTRTPLVSVVYLAILQY